MAALHSKWVGNLLRYFAGTNNILDVDGDNACVDILSLKLNGTAVTATAANLNAVPTATGTGAEIDEMTKNVMSSASTVPLSASAAVQTCTFTAKDADGNTIAAVQRVRAWLSSDAAGTTLASAANGTVAPTTGTILKAHTAKLDWDLLTSAGGVIVLSIDNTGGTDHYAVYVNVALPNGKVKTSLVTDVRSA